MEEECREKDPLLEGEALLKRGVGGVLSHLGWFIAVITLAVTTMLFFAEVHLEVRSILDFAISSLLLFFAACLMYFSLSDAGAAMLIEEKDLSAQSIKECVEEIYTQKEKAESLRRNIEKFALQGAAEAIYKDMQELMSGELLKNLIKEEKA